MRPEISILLLACTVSHAIIISNISDYCHCGGVQCECQNLKFGGVDILELDVNQKLNASDLSFVDSHLDVVPRNALRISQPVQRLSVRGCHLKRLHKTSFITGPENASVVFLDLNSNHINVIPSEVFENLGTLEYLYLEHNDIKVLEDNCFHNLAKLRVLWMYDNKLQTINEGIFEPLKSLETVYLSDNRLSFLPRSTFANNPKLKSVTLSNNNLKIVDVNVVKNTRSMQFMLQYINKFVQITDVAVFQHPNLKLIDVSENHFPYISSKTFAKTPNLTGLVAIRANLTFIEDGAFEYHENLVSLDLSYNLLQSFNPKLLKSHGNLAGNMTGTWKENLMFVGLRGMWSCGFQRYISKQFPDTIETNFDYEDCSIGQEQTDIPTASYSSWEGQTKPKERSSTTERSEESTTHYSGSERGSSTVELIECCPWRNELMMYLGILLATTIIATACALILAIYICCAKNSPKSRGFYYNLTDTELLLTVRDNRFN